MEQFLAFFSELSFFSKLLLPIIPITFISLIVMAVSDKSLKTFIDLEAIWNSFSSSLLVVGITFPVYMVLFLFNIRGWDVYYKIILAVCGVGVCLRIKPTRKILLLILEILLDIGGSSSDSSARSTSRAATATALGRTSTSQRTIGASRKVAPFLGVVKKSTSETNTDTPEGFNGNMTDIENKLSKGISVRLDYQKISWNVGCGTLEKARRSGAKITFYNLPAIAPNTVGRMIDFAKKAPGQIVFEGNIPPSFETVKLASAGGCFTCDCLRGSNLIADIAAGARKSNGHVKFINCNSLSSVDIKKIKEAGGNNVEIC